MVQRTSRRMTLLLSAVSLLLAATRKGWSQTAQAPELDTPKAKKIQALVEKAAQLVDSQGKAAFPEFHKKSSEWLTGDTYIFYST
jgi:cytochrome c